MSIPPSPKSPAVPGCIDINDANEIRYWTQALGISEEELRRLVGEFGTRAQDFKINRNR